MVETTLARRHIPELDGLRGLAALAVVADHLSKTYLPLVQGTVLHAMLSLWQFGLAGVDVFFALSGFLITGILLEKRGTPHSYRNFYMRRVLRLAPAYLLTLVLVGVLIPGSGPYLLLSFVYLANMSSFFHVEMSFGVFWSLSVEEHFYLLWPWLVRFIKLRGLAGVCVVVCVVTPLARIWAALYGTPNASLSWYRFDGLTWGALLALLLHSRFAAAWTRLFCVTAGVSGGVLSLAGMALVKGHARDAGLSLLFSGAAMVSTGVIGFAASEEKLRSLALLRSRLLRWVGEVSYWVYLTHYLALGATMILLQRYARVALAHAGWGVLLVSAVMTLVPTLVTGWAVRRWIELPVLRLKSRFR